MNRRTVFEDLHPLVSFCYFLLVLLLSMCLMHPVCLLISVVSAVVCLFLQEGCRKLRKMAWILIPMLLAALINPMFTHKGMTLLCYLPSGNPLTLESIFYGLGAAALLCGLLLWFRFCTDIMTTDKLMWLFGRIAPALSLVFSMTLRFVPRLSDQLKKIADAQKGLHIQRENTRAGKVRGAVSAVSALITWALDDALDTADSMKARGYGLPGRTSFSVYRLDERDKMVLVWLGFCAIFLLSGWRAGGFYWHYYPTCGGAGNRLSAALWICQLLLCCTPILLEVVGRLQQHNLRERRTDG